MQTLDPTVELIATADGYVEYLADDGTRWRIVGQCIACGECEVGVSDTEYQIWTGVPMGQPGACLDSRFGKRLDSPVRPEISKHPHCSLRGEYL